ncbi:MAG: NAD-dependent epimerase/dehydratase family protein [Acidobacteria bacterium]|nr:NAD-dependent epimerase/dehydratase family protein [Acidobacteriota bacterium]
MNQLNNAIAEQYRGVRALVLGASGFIGRWVARMLDQVGAQTFLAVRDQLTSNGLFSRYDIHGEIIEIDLVESESLRQAINDVRPSIVFNLAGYGVDRTERDEETAYLINGRLSETICESISLYTQPGWRGRRLVHVGSALEYGLATGNLDETTEPIPTTLYGRSKLAGTRAVTVLSEREGIQAVTARLFTVYGPGEHAGRLLPALIETASTRRPLALTDGLQLRDFTYVEDVAEGLLRLGLTSGLPGQVVNLATGQLTPVSQFIDSAAQILGIPPGSLLIGALPKRAEEMNHDPVIIERLKKMTNWMPETSIQDGIRNTMAFLTLQNSCSQQENA